METPSSSWDQTGNWRLPASRQPGSKTRSSASMSEPPFTPTNLVHILGQVVTVTSPPTGSGTTGTVELLPLLTRAAILVGMFSISDADVAAIVAASERGGEWLAKIELRRLFPSIPNNAEAVQLAVSIAGWDRCRPTLASYKRPLNRRAGPHRTSAPRASGVYSSASPGAFNHRHPSTE